MGNLCGRSAECSVAASSSFHADETSPAANLNSFSLNDLKLATENFDWNSLLGKGSFGRVYKGWIDEETFAPTKPGVGIAVAVKKHKSESHWGRNEWQAEVTYLGRLHHENIIKLVGYCAESDSKILVYEYMPGGSLANHLFREAQPISWEMRISIAVDVARALSFLHSLETQVIYRDLKSSHVLLDSDFRAKLSDFGLARNGPTGDETHVSTCVVGTVGFAAPEYITTGHLTAKCDVYNFGVLLLELISGRKAGSHLHEKREIPRMMDARLEGRYPRKEAKAVAALAFRCTHADPRKRPNMAEVLTALEEIKQSKDTSIAQAH
ncbi:probable serine/threonine-protein kinase PBL18 isoform X2 [Ananas comosus]|uniref:non-specific serine/threonine protein kinase n=1 Tax=Ananas comosus TaxID=4615 RepID=A0A6P5EZ04_ANACO|nr:probable serine/threonine-protein kinase PBL18 isoform X2 [Ananas comosus]